ncbi:MATE family efflux transporter [Azospirillum sp. sgz302134]
MTLPFASLLRRFSHGIWSLADQGAVSLGGFLSMVFLGRVLPQADYGLYTLIYAALLFLNTIHGALVTYPLLLEGARREDDGFANLVGVSAGATVGLTLLFAPGVVVLLSAFDAVALAPFVVAAVLGAQIHETLRRALMARLRHARAVAGDAVAYLGFPAALALLAWAGRLDLASAFAAMAGAFALGALVHALHLRVRPVGPAGILRTTVEHWPLVRWVLVANLVNVVGVQVMPWILVVFHGLDAAAALRALINPVALCHPLMFGIANAVLPLVAHARAEGRAADATRNALRQGIPMLLLPAPYLLALLLFPRAALELFYGPGNAYAADAPALAWAVVGYGFLLGTSLLEAILKGLGRPQDAFRAQLASVAVTLAAGFPLAARYGVEGATAGLMLSLAAQFLWNLRITLGGLHSAEAEAPARRRKTT